jgi:hypothetical protein
MHFSRPVVEVNKRIGLALPDRNDFLTTPNPLPIYEGVITGMRQIEILTGYHICIYLEARKVERPNEVSAKILDTTLSEFTLRLFKFTPIAIFQP